MMNTSIPNGEAKGDRRHLLKVLLAAPMAMPVLAGCARAAETGVQSTNASPLALAAAGN